MGSPAIGAALQYAELQLGGPLVENDTNPTCGTSATVLIDGSGDRVGLVIVNLGANNVYISTDSNVSTTNGILLSANGGNISMDVVRDFTFPSRRWWGIASGGTSACFVLELVRFTVRK